MRTIPSLTGIRGLAAFLVLLFHLPLAEMFGLRSAIPVIRNGYFGVDLFFLLSGFILGYVHMKDFREITLSGLKRFAVLRFFRVYPLHLIVLLCIAAWVVSHPDFVVWVRSLPGQNRAFSLGAFIQTLTLTNRIGLPYVGEFNGPSWSLSAEVVGYVAFPFLVWAVLRLHSVAWSLAFVAVSMAAFIVSTTQGHMGVTRMIFCFPAGLALAFVVGTVEEPPRWASVLITASLFEAVSALAMDKAAPFAVLGFAGMIVGLALSDKGLVARVLSSRPMLFLGTISFSLYLTHLTIQMAIIWLFWDGKVANANPGSALALIIGADMVVATVAYHLIERPSHRLGRSYAAREKARVDHRTANIEKATI